jgi:hypothetical protein
MAEEKASGRTHLPERHTQTRPAKEEGPLQQADQEGHVVPTDEAWGKHVGSATQPSTAVQLSSSEGGGRGHVQTGHGPQAQRRQALVTCPERILHCSYLHTVI